MELKQLLREKGFHFNKQFGQNFLTDDTLLGNIASDAEVCGGVVLEIGAGAGTLTRELSKKADRVIAFEIDRNLQSVLDVTLSDCKNVQVVIGDIMRYSMQDIEKLCDKTYKVVANIPYYITTPLIMRFMEEGASVKSLTLTIQKEVADRLVAKAATKEYGAITVAVDAVGDVTLTRVLPRELFYPQPNVDSAVVRIDINKNKYDITDKALFRKTVKAGFAMRRKTLVNNLINAFKLQRLQAEEIVTRCNLSLNCRGEELSTKQYVELYKTLQSVIK